MTPLGGAAVLEALGWAAGALGLWSIPTLGRENGGAGHHWSGRASIIVPARNESARLPALLASLRSELADGEMAGAAVLVVDDHSTDGTASLARAAGARVVAAPELPDGWTGKSWACWTGVQASTQEVLVFLDADTELEPGGVGRLLAAQQKMGGLLSVQPFHVTERGYESLSAFPNLVSLMAVGACTPLGDWLTPTGAFGPCLICRRADYLEVGGHAEVRGEIAEDIALAGLFRAHHLPVRVRGGRGAVRFRMYPEGAGSLAEGWTKNLAAGARSTRPVLFLGVFLWITALILGAAGLAGALLGVGPTRHRLGLALLTYGAFAAEVHWMLRRAGRFRWWTAVVYPVPLAVFVGLLARSLGATLMGRPVGWRGRRVPPRGLAD